MGKWHFKAAQRGPGGGMELVELSADQQKRVGRYAEALATADESTVANPVFSKYFVKEGIVIEGQTAVSAGNVEYGFCQALHGEEAAIAAYRSRFGRRGNDNPVLGLIAGVPGNVATPCGNCRDILLEDLGTDFEIVSGASEGGLAVVANMGLYLYEDYERQDGKGKILWPSYYEKSAKAVRLDRDMANDAYSPPDVHPERKYCALIITRDAEYFGAHDLMCDYHPIYALRDAVRQARRANDPFVEHVLIVRRSSDGRPPHVMYKDRQHLMELCLQGDLVQGRETDPPVSLMTVDGNEANHRLWETNVKQWLPFPFTPRNFGPEFVSHLTQYYRSLGRQ